MRRISLVLILLFAVLPLSVIALEKGTNSESTDMALKTLLMIDSRVFMEKGGVEKMQAVSSNLSLELREFEYAKNVKCGAWGLVDLLIPSLGNWIVGDNVGGIVGVVGFTVGLAMSVGSYWVRDYSARSTISVISSMIGLTSYIYSPISAFIYSGEYNNKLKAGLSIVSVDLVDLNHVIIAEALNSPKSSPQLFYLNLLSYAF